MDSEFLSQYAHSVAQPAGQVVVRTGSHAMNFDLTEQQVAVQLAVRELASKYGPDYWREVDHAHSFPTAFYQEFVRDGWLGIAIPAEYGGGGLGMQEAGLVMEEIAASGAAMNGCSAVHITIFSMNVLVKHGSQAMRNDVLPAIAEGKLHVCFGVTEPDAGTDTSRVTTFARRDRDSFVITGRKVWISKADMADKMLLLARTTARNDAASTRGLSLFLVDMDRDHIHCRPIPKMGRNAVSSNEVLIDELRVPTTAMVGNENDGFRCLLDALNPERILLAHEAVGIGRIALETATRYAKERYVFGRPIGQNQGISFQLAESRVRLDSARLIARLAAWLYDEGRPCGAEANMAKFLCADAGFHAADIAVQAHGGMGYAEEYHVERYFRESRLPRLAPVSQEMALNYVAEHVLGLPKSY